MTAKILVTGGAGFIGSEIVKQLSAHDEYEIRVLDALTKQIHGNNPEKSYLFQSIKDCCDFIRGDVRDFTTVRKALEGVDVVLHLAAETGTGQSMYMINQYNEVNVMGLSNIFQALSLKGGKQHYTQSHPVVIAFCVWRRRVSMPKLWRSLPPWTQN